MRVGVQFRGHSMLFYIVIAFSTRICTCTTFSPHLQSGDTTQKYFSKPCIFFHIFLALYNRLARSVYPVHGLRARLSSRPSALGCLRRFLLSHFTCMHSHHPVHSGASTLKLFDHLHAPTLTWSVMPSPFFHISSLRISLV